MVGRRDDDGVARQRVDLQQQRTNDALDLPGLMLVTALLRDGIELIEEENAPPGTREGEHRCQPCRGLTQVAADDLLVADGDERQQQGFRHGLGE